MTRKASDAEEDLRLACEAWARRRWPDARVVHELNIAYGSNRIDLAAVSPDYLGMIELKSERDTLKRAEWQVAAARRCASEVWIALDVKFEKKLGEIALPWDVGVLIYEQGALRCVDYRHSRPLFPQAQRMLQLLWAAELRAAFGNHGNMNTAIRYAVDNYGLKHITGVVCHALRGRTFARGDAPLHVGPKGRLFT